MNTSDFVDFHREKEGSEEMLDSLHAFTPDQHTFVQHDMLYVMRYWVPDRSDAAMRYRLPDRPDATVLVPICKSFPKGTALTSALRVVQQFPAEEYCELFVYVDLEVYDSKLRCLTRIYGEQYPEALPISAYGTSSVPLSSIAYARRDPGVTRD